MTKAAELLGVLSATSLDNITARFLKEVGSRLQADSASFIRQELLNLCNGLRFIRLRAGTSEEVRMKSWLGWVEIGACSAGGSMSMAGHAGVLAAAGPHPSQPLTHTPLFSQLRASIAFLEAAHPLKHVASDKKSRVQQSICDMLSCILQPIVDGADAGCVLGGGALGQGWGRGGAGRAPGAATAQALAQNLLPGADPAPVSHSLALYLPLAPPSTPPAGPLAPAAIRA